MWHEKAIQITAFKFEKIECKGYLFTKPSFTRPALNEDFFTMKR